MQHKVRKPQERRLRAGVALLPRLETLEKLHPPFLYGRAIQPSFDGILFKRNEDALTPVLNRWQPRNIWSERCAPYVEHASWL